MNLEKVLEEITHQGRHYYTRSAAGEVRDSFRERFPVLRGFFGGASLHRASHLTCELEELDPTHSRDRRTELGSQKIGLIELCLPTITPFE